VTTRNRFTVIDRGFDDFVEAFEGMEDAAVTIVVHQSDNEIVEDGEISLAELMAVHSNGAAIQHPGGTPYTIIDDEFIPLPEGHDAAIGKTDPHIINIPPRPVLKIGIESNQRSMVHTIERALNAVLDDKTSLEHGLNLVGDKAKGFVKSTFSDSEKLEPNAESTKEKKGSGGPLFDEGQLRASIDYQVTGT